MCKIMLLVEPRVRCWCFFFSETPSRHHKSEQHKKVNHTPQTDTLTQWQSTLSTATGVVVPSGVVSVCLLLRLQDVCSKRQHQPITSINISSGQFIFIQWLSDTKRPNIRANGFAVFCHFWSCTANRERILVLRYSTAAYESNVFISLPFGKYWTNLQKVSE